jgi:hypothetical protein
VVKVLPALFDDRFGVAENVARQTLEQGHQTYLDDRERAALLCDYLLPYDGQTIMVGFIRARYGAAARYLGLLATKMK